jgi:hypothetical protein
MHLRPPCSSYHHRRVGNVTRWWYPAPTISPPKLWCCTGSAQKSLSPSPEAGTQTPNVKFRHEIQKRPFPCRTWVWALVQIEFPGNECRGRIFWLQWVIISSIPKQCVYLLPTLICGRFTTLSAVVRSQSQSTTDSQSASLSWCQAPIWDLRPIFPLSVFLRSESHGTHEHILLSLLFRLPQPGGPGSCIYFPGEQGSPVIPLGIGSPSCKCHILAPELSVIK